MTFASESCSRSWGGTTASQHADQDGYGGYDRLAYEGSLRKEQKCDPSKQANGVARQRLLLCLMFGVPKASRAYERRELTADAIYLLCRWLKARNQYEPAGHPRAQGSDDKFDGSIQDVLSELYAAWPRRWEEYMTQAFSIKHTLPIGYTKGENRMAH